MTSRIPDSLDPATLRWLADRQVFNAEYWAEIVRRDRAQMKLGTAAAWLTEGMLSHIDDRVRELKDEAKWLRAVATRIENRRRR